MNTPLNVLEEVEALKTSIDRALPPDVRARMADLGLGLTLGSAFTGPFQIVGGKPVEAVAVDKTLPDQLVEEELTASMVSYRKNVTGVDNTIFISTAFPRHLPRIKVAIEPPTHLDRFGDNAAVLIADGSVLEGKLPTKVRDQVKQFLELNRDALLKYWNKEIDDEELRAGLKPVLPKAGR